MPAGPGARGAGGGAGRGRAPQLRGDRSRRARAWRTGPRATWCWRGPPARRRGRSGGPAPAARGPRPRVRAGAEDRSPAPSSSAARPRSCAARAGRGRVPPAHAGRARFACSSPATRRPSSWASGSWTWRRDGLLRTDVVARNSTGLTRPEFFNWEVNARQEIADRRAGRGGDADGRQRRLQRDRGRRAVRPVHARVGDRVRAPHRGGDARAGQRAGAGRSTGRPRPPRATRSSTASTACRTSPWRGPPAAVPGARYVDLYDDIDGGRYRAITKIDGRRGDLPPGRRRALHARRGPGAGAAGGARDGAGLPGAGSAALTRAPQFTDGSPGIVASSEYPPPLRRSASDQMSPSRERVLRVGAPPRSRRPRSSSLVELARGPARVAGVHAQPLERGLGRSGSSVPSEPATLGAGLARDRRTRRAPPPSPAPPGRRRTPLLRVGQRGQRGHRLGHAASRSGG